MYAVKNYDKVHTNKEKIDELISSLEADLFCHKKIFVVGGIHFKNPVD